MRTTKNARIIEHLYWFINSSANIFNLFQTIINHWTHMNQPCIVQHQHCCMMTMTMTARTMIMKPPIYYRLLELHSIWNHTKYPQRIIIKASQQLLHRTKNTIHMRWPHWWTSTQFPIPPQTQARIQITSINWYAFVIRSLRETPSTDWPMMNCICCASICQPFVQTKPSKSKYSPHKKRNMQSFGPITSDASNSWITKSWNPSNWWKCCARNIEILLRIVCGILYARMAWMLLRREHSYWIHHILNFFFAHCIPRIFIFQFTLQPNGCVGFVREKKLETRLYQIHNNIPRNEWLMNEL